MSDEKITNRGPVKRDPTCYRVERDIVIPAGTILRQAAPERGGRGFVEAEIGFGKQHAGHFVIKLFPDGCVAENFSKVISA